MKSKRLFTAIGNIDDRFIEEDAEVSTALNDSKNERTKTFTPWLKFAMPVAACLVIAVSVFIGQNRLPPLNNGNGIGIIDSTLSDDYSNSNPNDGVGNQSVPSADSTTPNDGVVGADSEGHDDVILQVAYGFMIGDKLYSPIAFDERKKFGLVEQSADGLTADNTYVITEEDLGEIIGVVEGSADDSLIGATVYHYSAYPDSEAIVIVNVKASVSNGEPIPQNSLYSSDSDYQFYTFSYMPSSLGSLKSDEILDNYGVTGETVVQVTVLASDWSPVTIITDSTKISEIVEIICGQEDIGLTAHEDLMQSWLKPYDDKDVDRAQLFLEIGQRVIIITTKTGIELSFVYNPFVKSLCTHDSFYILPEDSVVAMNTLLMVSQ